MLVSGTPAYQRCNMGPNGHSRIALLRLRERSSAHLLQSTNRSRCGCSDSSSTYSRRHAHVPRFSQVAHSQLPVRSETDRCLFVDSTWPAHPFTRRMCRMQMFDEWPLAVSKSTSTKYQRNERRATAKTCQVGARILVERECTDTLFRCLSPLETIPITSQMCPFESRRHANDWHVLPILLDNSVSSSSASRIRTRARSQADTSK